LGILLPAVSKSRKQALVTRVHSDLHQVELALTSYMGLWKDYPPARSYCGTGDRAKDYYELPIELETHGLPQRLVDPFNKPRYYKYLKPGFGYHNDVATKLSIWVPEDFPEDGPEEDDEEYHDVESSPVKYALWSVGPGEPSSFWESWLRHEPVPKRLWFPNKKDGLIVHVYTGKEY